MEGVVATRGRSGLAVSEDGEVSVNREVTMTALARDEEGNVYLNVTQARTRQVVGQVAGIIAITGREEESTPRTRHSVTMPDNDETSTKRYHYYNDETSTKCNHCCNDETSMKCNHCCNDETSRKCNHCCNDGISMKKVLVCVFSIIFGSVPVAMTVFGIIDYYQCPGNTTYAIYMIAQGATSVFIPILASWWCCCHCISGKFIISCCVIIGLFNVAWGIFGTIVMLSNESCKDTWDHNFGFAITLWILFGLLSLISFCFMFQWCCIDD